MTIVKIIGRMSMMWRHSQWKHSNSDNGYDGDGDVDDADDADDSGDVAGQAMNTPVHHHWPHHHGIWINHQMMCVRISIHSSIHRGKPLFEPLFEVILFAFRALPNNLFTDSDYSWAYYRYVRPFVRSWPFNFPHFVLMPFWTIPQKKNLGISSFTNIHINFSSIVYWKYLKFLFSNCHQNWKDRKS